MRKRITAVLAVDIAALCVILLAPFLSERMLTLLPDCWVASFGFFCPVCGGTHCINALLSGDVSAAFSANPFVFCLLIYVFILLLLFNLSVFPKLRIPDKGVKVMSHTYAIIIIAVLAVVFGFLRNML